MEVGKFIFVDPTNMKSFKEYMKVENQTKLNTEVVKMPRCNSAKREDIYDSRFGNIFQGSRLNFPNTGNYSGSEMYVSPQRPENLQFQHANSVRSPQYSHSPAARLNFVSIHP